MFSFIFSFVLIFAEAAKSESGWQKFLNFWNTYLNYPGFEAWRFFNLAIFIFIVYRLLKKPLSNAFIAKREVIRADLIRAEEQRQAALAKLTETEAKLASLEADTEAEMKQAEEEAANERLRIEKETEAEIERLKAQSANEIMRKTQQVQAALRRFSAEESIRLAEEKLKAKINPETDAKLVKATIQSIGGMR